MTLTLEVPEQIERAAAQAQTDVSSFILEAATEKAATTYQDPSARRQLDALDALLSLGARLTAGAAPLVDEAVARSYEGHA